MQYIFEINLMTQIPIINIGPLFSQNASKKTEVDKAIARAAFEIGFMVVVGHPKKLEVGQDQRDIMLKLFNLSEKQQRPFWKKNFASENSHIYRGWFPLSSSKAHNREGFEIGPDIVRALPSSSDNDILYEPTPIPKKSDLPQDWKKVTAKYYIGMEDIGNCILDSLSRSLSINKNIFRNAFKDGISTLRLLHYPKVTTKLNKREDLPNRYTNFQGKNYEQVARPHVDSGLLTVLAQCGIGGLQAFTSEKKWVEVPIIDDSFSINFGGLLELWTGRKIKATKHRVLGQNTARHSVPFFFEPRPSTVISPLPIKTAQKFKPFYYGDHLWATTTKFPENYGLLSLRSPRGDYTEPKINY
jgi:isopenicillin N synthase-like dioxygenase